LRRLYVILGIMAFCFVLVPIIAYLFGGWYAYWGHAVLAIVFAFLAVFIKTHYYWEED